MLIFSVVIVTVAVKLPTLAAQDKPPTNLLDIWVCPKPLTYSAVKPKLPFIDT